MTKIVGVWLEERGGWAKNTAEICRSAYAKLSLLTKLKYAGVCTKDLLETYALFIRSRAEYVSVAFHSSLTKKQEKAIERIQSTCLKVILGEKYKNYDDALKVTGLNTLKQRREEKCLAFSLKCLKHPELKRLFPRNEKVYTLRNKEDFKVNFALQKTIVNLPSRIVKHCLTKEYFNSFTLRLSTFNVNNDLYPYTWSITF